MEITKELLKKLGASDSNISKYIVHLNNTIKKYNISTELQVSNFLAQLFHESMNLIYSAEIASGAAYEGRKDLGNTVKGDGVRFKGRGLIQLTGRANYTFYKKYSNIDVISNPQLLQEPEYAVDSAGWYWSIFKKDIAGNSLNDMALDGDFLRITYFVNGGFNGVKDRYNKLIDSYIFFNVPNIQPRIDSIYNEIAHAINMKKTAMQKAIIKAIPNESSLNAFIRSSFTPISNGKVTATLLKKGDSGGDVILLQKKLGITADGDFGPGTEKAVKSWQTSNGLTADGIVGNTTLTKMGLK